MRLKDKTAIVTGAGAGIGQATAELFAREGACVVAADWNANAAKETARRIQENGGKALAVKVDVSDHELVTRMMDAAVDAFHGIDVLFNNAGILHIGTVLETSREDWQRVLDVNLTGTFLVSKAVIPHMIRRGGGSIINASSSTGAHDALGRTAAYVTSKGGVALLTKCMAIDHATDNIRVNAICPGPTDTPMLRNALNQEGIDSLLATFPLGRLGRPEELAHVVLFLASDESSFVTGAMIAADGGQTASV